MDKTCITAYYDSFCILAPVFYEINNRPAWRVVYVGTKAECNSKIKEYPEHINATPDENKRNKNNLIKEYLFIKDCLKSKKSLDNFLQDIKPEYKNFFKGEQK